MLPNVIMKKGPERVDPKRPQSHPDFEEVQAKAKIAAKGLKFESEGDRRDYERAVARNPNNVYGFPAFYPALKIRSFITEVPNAVQEAGRREEEMIRESIRQAQIRNVDLYCPTCNAVRPHSVSPDASFCKSCGTQGKVRTAWL